MTYDEAHNGLDGMRFRSPGDSRASTATHDRFKRISKTANQLTRTFGRAHPCKFGYFMDALPETSTCAIEDSVLVLRRHFVLLR